MSVWLQHGIVRLLRGIIWMYRATISPFLPPDCRFVPTCSEYAMEALETHGAVRGSYLALRRLSRCHPIKFLGGASGFDPVPGTSTSQPSCGCTRDGSKTATDHTHL